MARLSHIEQAELARRSLMPNMRTWQHLCFCMKRFFLLTEDVRALSPGFCMYRVALSL